MAGLISFAWTTPAFVNGHKTVTRRSWSDRYAKRHHAGDLLAAYDKDPRAGGRPIGVIRLTADPIKEPWSAAPDSDWEAEGFHYMAGLATDAGSSLHGPSALAYWNEAKIDGGLQWVIRFNIERLFPRAELYRDHRPRPVFVRLNGELV